MKNNMPYENYTPKQLLEICSDLFDEEKYEDIINMLENIEDYVSGDNEDDDDVISLIFTLGLSYEKLGDQLEEVQYCEKSIVLLNHFKELLEDTYLWNYLIGKAYYILDELEKAIFHLEKSFYLKPNDIESRIYLAGAYYLSNQEEKALYYYNQLLEIDEENEILREKIELCLHNLSMPFFEEPFRDRVEYTWELFEKQEKKIRKVLDELETIKNEREVEIILYDNLLPTIHDILTISLDVPCFECRKEGEKYHLYLSTNGVYFRAHIYSYFIRKMPDSLKKYWNVEIGLVEQENPKIQLQNLVIDGSEFSIWVEKEEERLVISAFAEQLVPVIKQNQQYAYDLMLKLMMETLGETVVLILKNMKKVDFTLLHQIPKEKIFSKNKPISLFELKQTLEEQGYIVSNSLDEYLKMEYHYERTPKEDISDGWNFRDDITYGESKIPMLEETYEDGETIIFDVIYGMGAIAGFFSIPLESFVHDGMVSGDQLEELENNLVKYIEENAGTDVITVIGRALGLACIYIDFLAWDINEVLRTAHDFFEQTDLEWANYHSYRAGTTLVKLHRK